MAELARGNVADRPWGQTLGRLGARGLTGQLDVHADGKAYSVVFASGAVVGAHSPLANDSAVRIALTGHLVTSTQVSEIMRRITAAPQRDEIEVLAEVARLAPEHVHRLRRRAVAQRAARTFSLDRGEFVVHDRVTLPASPGDALDVRAVIYLGARSHLADARLAAEVDQLGAWFKLKPDAVADLGQFGFSDAEKPVLQRLLEGATLKELALVEPQLDNRAVRAIVYALAAYGACDTNAPPGVARTQTPAPAPAPRGKLPTDLPTFYRAPSSPPGQELEAPALPRTRTSSQRAASQGPGVPGAPAIGRAPTPVPGVPAASPASGRTPTPQQPATGRTPTPQQPAIGRTPTPMRPVVARAPTPQRPLGRPRSTGGVINTNAETEKLILAMAPLVERGANHFELLGLPFDAPVEAVRTAYFNLARRLHPDRLAALGITDAAKQAQRVFAQVNTAFAVLTDPQRRAEYLELQQRGGEAAVRSEENKAEELAARVLKAEEAFRQGEMALRREQFAQAVAAFTTACELQPKEPEYQALLAWAKFAAAPDKQAAAAATRQALQRAAADSPESVTARFYLGRVERMLGREKEALAHFQEVLGLKPHHAEAASEVRVLEQRLKGRR